MAAFVVDTDIASEILLGDWDLASSLANLQRRGDRVYFSEATRGELHSWSSASAPDLAKADTLLASVDAVLDVDSTISRKAGELRRLSSHSVGQRCPSCGKVTGGKLKLPDAMIAATAVTEGATLITNNGADYQPLVGYGVLKVMSGRDLIAQFGPQQTGQGLTP